MIRHCDASDIPVIYEIINDAAMAYQGHIPEDLWHEPYMPLTELRQEIGDGVAFWGYEKEGRLVGVMGIQDKGEVTLIRHAYVRTAERNGGIGGQLLQHLLSLGRTPGAGKPVLIGTWTAAAWAIAFYEKHGFRLVSGPERAELLRKYWRVSPRHALNSVVLAEAALWENGAAALRGLVNAS